MLYLKGLARDGAGHIPGPSDVCRYVEDLSWSGANAPFTTLRFRPRPIRMDAAQGPGDRPRKCDGLEVPLWPLTGYLLKGTPNARRAA